MNPTPLIGRFLLAACLLLPAAATLTHASTLSKAERTSESMEPALSFPEQEQATADQEGEEEPFFFEESSEHRPRSPTPGSEMAAPATHFGSRKKR